MKEKPNSPGCKKKKNLVGQPESTWERNKRASRENGRNFRGKDWNEIGLVAKKDKLGHSGLGINSHLEKS